MASLCINDSDRRRIEVDNLMAFLMDVSGFSVYEVGLNSMHIPYTNARTQDDFNKRSSEEVHKALHSIHPYYWYSVSLPG